MVCHFWREPVVNDPQFILPEREREGKLGSVTD